MSLLTQVGQLLQNPAIGLASQVGRLFFPREYKILSSDESVEIKIDTVPEERHESLLNITKFAVEQGADMSDHFSVAPSVFNLTGAISDISSNEIIDFAIPSLPDFSDKKEETGSRSQLAWRELIALQESGRFVEYRSQLRTYTNMLITRLAVVQNKDTSKAIVFEMTLEQIRTAEFEVVKGKGVFKRKGSKNAKKGKSSTEARNSSAVQKGTKQGEAIRSQTTLAKLLG